MRRGDNNSRTVLAVGEDSVSVTSLELDRLQEALARLEQRDADAVREQIGALRLLGSTIGLTPTQAELAALEAARASLADQPLEPQQMRAVTANTDDAGAGRRRQ